MSVAIQLLCVAFLVTIVAVYTFNSGPYGRIRALRPANSASRGGLTMEYIPDGMSKAQWEVIKKKEKDAVKGKNFGAVGITKFKSRSFEAWQKSGGKNLFPVDPNTPEEEKPYMQRKGGRADGSDLKKRGLFGRGQGMGIASDVDEKYDKLEKEGKLKSTNFELPWSKAQAKKIDADKMAATKAATKAAKTPKKKVGKPSPFGAAAKAKRAAALAEAEAEPEPAPKKKLFGLF